MSEKTNENNEQEEIKVEGQKVDEKKIENIDKKVKKENKPEKSIAREIMEWIVCIAVAFALALFIKYYVFTPTLVMQDSMTPTILNGERVLINRLVRTFGWDLERGDIITFEAPSNSEYANGEITAKYYDVEGVINSFFYNVMEIGKISYIKRVIGIPGDFIEIKDGSVYVNGELQSEDYLQREVETYIPEGGIPSSFTVPEGYIFALGDNREHSTDCRALGCIPIEKVEGKVTTRIWPLNVFGKIDK